MDAIALYPSGSVSGAWVFLHLDTLSTIMRRHAKPEPMSDLVINLLSNMPRQEKDDDVHVPIVVDDDHEVVAKVKMVAAEEMTPGDARDDVIADDDVGDTLSDDDGTLSDVRVDNNAVIVEENMINVDSNHDAELQVELPRDYDVDMINSVDAAMTRPGRVCIMKLVGECVP